jgi:hypothetical protein
MSLAFLWGVEAWRRSEAKSLTPRRRFSLHPGGETYFPECGEAIIPQLSRSGRLCREKTMGKQH